MVDVYKICYIYGMDNLEINYLRQLCTQHKIFWTSHIVVRLLQRGIMQEDVENAILTGEIIEQYPEDYPNPSCLVLGLTVGNEMIHVVCGICDDTLWMITAYYPDLAIWEKDLKTRKKGGKRK